MIRVEPVIFETTIERMGKRRSEGTHETIKKMHLQEHMVLDTPFNVKDDHRISPEEDASLPKK